MVGKAALTRRLTEDVTQHGEGPLQLNVVELLARRPAELDSASLLKEQRHNQTGYA